MKKTIFTFLLAAIFSVTLSIDTQAQKASQWKVDGSHSSVTFDVNHLFSAVTGRFKDFDGEIYFDPDNLKVSSAVFTVNVKSIDTDDDDRNSHLQSDDFFAAEDFPQIRFVSSGFTKTGADQYDVQGKLTMRGTTKSVVLPLTVMGIMDSPWVDGQVIMGVQIKTSLDRTEYKVGTGSWAATAIVGDEVRIKIDLEMQSNKD